MGKRVKNHLLMNLKNVSIQSRKLETKFKATNYANSIWDDSMFYSKTQSLSKFWIVYQKTWKIFQKRQNHQSIIFKLNYSSKLENLLKLKLWLNNQSKLIQITKQP